MTETFRAVEPLRMGGVTFAKCDGDLVVIPDYSAFTVAEARVLHRWLTAALPLEPCEELGHRWLETGIGTFECTVCGATLP